MTHAPRAARPDEIEPLARLWHDGWHDAHAAIVPRDLVGVRTLGEMRDRLPHYLSRTRVIGPDGAPLGMAILREDELYQFYVAAAARGTGLAATLLADAEARIAAQGHGLAWLGCARGNDRAARFYGRHGWRCMGDRCEDVETAQGPMPLTVWRFEKPLAGPCESGR